MALSKKRDEPLTIKKRRSCLFFLITFSASFQVIFSKERANMCFSANASFGSAVILGVIGIGALLQVSGKTQVAIALIPMFFAVQQLARVLCGFRCFIRQLRDRNLCRFMFF
jgi:hypothetical protein